MSGPSDPYGRGQPSRLVRPGPSTGEVVPTPGLPRRYPPYLKPIPINTRSVAAQLNGALRVQEPKVVRILYSTWNADAKVIKYQELRNAVRDGELPAAWFEKWQQNYSVFVNQRLKPRWEAVAETAHRAIAGDLTAAAFRAPTFEATFGRLDAWTSARAGELAVRLSAEQSEALRGALRYYTTIEPVGMDALAKNIRAVIGLTYREQAAVEKYRQALIAEGTPAARMEHLSGNYYGYLHRRRALRIARTESAFAFNHATQDAMLTAVSAGDVRGIAQKGLLLAEDEAVCPWCRGVWEALQEQGGWIGLEETFPGSTERVPDVYVPPLHPNCRCSAIYRVMVDERIAA